MAITQADLSNFHQFACAKLASDKVETMHELFDLWLMRYPSQQEQTDTMAAIREGLADVEAGRIHNFDDVNAEIRVAHGWSSET